MGGVSCRCRCEIHNYSHNPVEPKDAARCALGFTDYHEELARIKRLLATEPIKGCKRLAEFVKEELPGEPPKLGLELACGVELPETRRKIGVADVKCGYGKFEDALTIVREATEELTKEMKRWAGLA